MSRRGTLWDRFWKRADVRGLDECWPWQGVLQPRGYGTIRAAVSDGGAKLLAHRVAYELTIGPIPTGLTIDHLCRTRSCVNPIHMEPVTSRENTLRGEGLAAQRARATCCPNGHEYTVENVRIKPSGTRQCIACRKANDQKRRAKQSEGSA